MVAAIIAMAAVQAVTDPASGADGDEPLRDASAYSLEVSQGGTSAGYYPLGVLGDRFDIGFSPFIGANYRAVTMTPESDFPSGLAPATGVSIQACKSVWLDKSLPKATGPDGRPLRRRPICLFDRASVERALDYARRTVANAVAKGDASIFKWEIDNEFVPEMDYSPQAVAAFREWLAKRYGGDLAKFRAAWGLGSFGEAAGVPPEDRLARPVAFLDWTVFQQETFAAFLAEYCKAVCDADPRRRPVHGKDTQTSFEMVRLARVRRADHALIADATAPWRGGLRGIDHYGHGDRNAYEMNFFANTAAGPGWRPGERRGVLYGENNNHGGPGRQWARTLWRMPPNGLKGGSQFCAGHFGAHGDWESFAFVRPDSTKREKFWYLPRFAAAIHRAERFFAESAPAPDSARIAILFPQRDMPFGEDSGKSPWEYAVNSRLEVFSRLRDAGFFVDVIPCSHLADAEKPGFRALFLVGAERLSDGEVEALRGFVARGGAVFCDSRCGAFDERGFPRADADGLSQVLGVAFDAPASGGDATIDPGDVWTRAPGGAMVRGDGKTRIRARSAAIANPDDVAAFGEKAALFTVNRYGNGVAFWTNTRLGALRDETGRGAGEASLLTALLASAGVVPSYLTEGVDSCRIRVERPLVDGRGSCVVMAAAASDGEIVPPFRLRMDLPAGVEPRTAFASLAEGNALLPLPFSLEGRSIYIEMPRIESAVAVYLVSDGHPPLLGTRFDWDGATVAEGESTPLVKPGERFAVTVQAANPSSVPLEGASLRVRALKGWTVRELAALGVVPPGGIAEARYEIEVGVDGPEMRPNHVQPVTADLFVGDRRVAVTHTVVQADVNKSVRELLLSDNWVSADCQWSEWTGASYRYADGERGVDDKVHARRPDGSAVRALQSGDREGAAKYATWKGRDAVCVEWDLKGRYGVTRLLVKRGRFGGARDPASFSYSFSLDGKSWTPAAEVPFACDGKGFCEAAPAGRTDARFVRLAFNCREKDVVQIDEIWIFGMLPETARDVVVYGGTPGGIAAAIEAGRHGARVVLVEPGTRVGGLTTGGLGQTDIGNKEAFGGIALEFYRRIARWYRDDRHWTRQDRAEYMPDGQCSGTKGADSMWTFEPSAALAVLEEWLREEGVEVVKNARLDRGRGGVAVSDGPRISSFRTEDGRTFRGRVFVDATYEGDLMAAAGVSYHVGREANSVYGETVNGIQRARADTHQFWPGVDPYVVKGDPSSGLLPGVSPDVPDPDGAGDARVQAYCFRACLTDDPANRIPFEKPAAYDPLDYELLLRQLEASGRPENAAVAKAWQKGPPWINSKMPNRKTDTNNRNAFSSDFVGGSWRWPEASHAVRSRILREHLEYQKGLYWTLANSPRVPGPVRREVARWGTCRDEFHDGLGGGWQNQLYVREARRMKGEYTMTERNCRGAASAPRPVALAAYQMDSHNCRRHVGADGFVRNEGDLQDWVAADGSRPFPPYPVDYGAIVPKRAECGNLLVPVCVSASHAAFGSIRMEPAFFALGHAAGAAAAIAVRSGIPVQDVSYGELRETLLSEGQVLDWKRK